MARHRWIAGLAVAAVLVGSGVLFAVQGLDRADQYASVGSFLLALVTAGLAILDRARAQREEPTKPLEDPDGLAARNIHAHDIDLAQFGANSIGIVNRGNESPGRRRGRR